MKVLLRNAKITSSSSPFNGQSKDILIEDGVITRIADQIFQDDAKLIAFDNLHVSEGWQDCFANFCDPGYEYKETLESGSLAAATGGFTGVMLIPNTDPIIHSKTQVEYIIQSQKILPVNLYPIGAVTKLCDGKELTEMYDMQKSGAVAFSDGLCSIQSAGIMLKALQYLLADDVTLIQIPDDKSIGNKGLMNEGIVSTRLGLPGKPALSEHLIISRDIEIAAYTGSKLHFTGISTIKSLQLILDAKAAGVRVSCSVTPHHLFFCDEELRSYDTNFKVNPPLRSKSDRDALREAARSGKIDFIASHHEPQHWDNKTSEFEYAKFGIAGLETMFSVAMTCGIDIQTFVNMQTVNIRKIFQLPNPVIEVGSEAQLTLFNPDIEFKFDVVNMSSKSRNNPFNDKTLKGKSFGIINREKLFLNK